MLNLIVACFSHSLNLILDVRLNLSHSFRIVTVINRRHLLDAASGPHKGRIGVACLCCSGLLLLLLRWCFIYSRSLQVLVRFKV